MQIQNQPKYAAFRQNNLGMSTEDRSHFRCEEQKTAEQALQSAASEGPDPVGFEQVGQNNLNLGRFKPLKLQKSSPDQIQNIPCQNDSSGTKASELYAGRVVGQKNRDDTAQHYNLIPRHPKENFPI